VAVRPYPSLNTRPPAVWRLGREALAVTIMHLAAKAPHRRGSR